MIPLSAAKRVLETSVELHRIESLLRKPKDQHVAAFNAWFDAVGEYRLSDGNGQLGSKDAE